jgi:hypothetical protein
MSCIKIVFFAALIYELLEEVEGRGGGLNPATWSCPGFCRLAARPPRRASKKGSKEGGFFKSVRKTINLRRSEPFGQKTLFAKPQILFTFVGSSQD